MKSGTLVRKGAIFGTIVALGITLSWMLGGASSHKKRDTAQLPVVEVPIGTSAPGSRGVPGTIIIGAEDLEVAPTRLVTLDDGTRVAFRALVLNATSQSPLPSPGKGIERVAIKNPVVRVRQEPRTRADLEGLADAPVSLFSAPRGELERGPGETARLLLEGGVEAHTVREGTPWTFQSDTAAVDLETRQLQADGAVIVKSPDLEIRGHRLETLDDRKSLVLSGGAEGSVDRTGGTSLAGGSAGEPVNFSCTGPFKVISLAPPADDPGAARHRIVLEENSVVRQGEARLTGDRVAIDVLRPSGDGERKSTVEVVTADGSVTFKGGRNGRELEASAAAMTARPVPASDGRPAGTGIDLRGSPRMQLLSTEGDRAGATIDVSGTDSALLFLPDGVGRMTGTFRGGAHAIYLRPVAGGDPVRHDLRARNLLVEGERTDAEAEGFLLRRLDADGEASLAEGDRRAAARRMVWTPQEDGGSILDLEQDIAVRWPASGSLDPLARVANATPATDGTLLLSSPGRARLVLPAEGSGAGASVDLRGGSLVRRMSGEQEVYSLSSSALQVTLHADTRAVEQLEAVGKVRFAGRGEGPGKRRYAVSGARLRVLGSADASEPSVLKVDDAGDERARVNLVDKNGEPVELAGSKIVVDRDSGRFSVLGPVIARGLLPQREASGLPVSAEGRATLRCEALDGVFGAGQAEGSTEIRSVAARGAVSLATGNDRATGDRLDYDAADGLVSLRGNPARLTAGSRVIAGQDDGCEAPLVLLTLDDAGLKDARAPTGGRFVRHRQRASEDGKTATPERLVASCEGPLVYGRDRTLMREKVQVIRSAFVDGAFLEKERMTGADLVSLEHPRGESGQPLLEGARAVSATNDLEVVGDGGRWRATGIGNVVLDATRDRLAMETPKGRFRVIREGGTDWFRRVVYDYTRRIFAEQVGATVGAPR